MSRQPSGRRRTLLSRPTPLLQVSSLSFHSFYFAISIFMSLTSGRTSFGRSNSSQSYDTQVTPSEENHENHGAKMHPFGSSMLLLPGNGIVSTWRGSPLLSRKAIDSLDRLPHALRRLCLQAEKTFVEATSSLYNRAENTVLNLFAFVTTTTCFSFAQRLRDKSPS